MLPASFLAAVVGSGLVMTWLAATAVLVEGVPDPLTALQMVAGMMMIAIIPIIIATVICAFYIGLVGVPIAALLGHRLESPFGIAVTVAAALLAGLAASIGFGARLLFDTPDWQFALLVLTYALPAGLLYRREVLNARLFSPFAPPETSAA